MVGNTMRTKDISIMRFYLKGANLVSKGDTSLHFANIKFKAEINSNLRSREPFYHAEQDIIIVSEPDTKVLVFNENYRVDGVVS